VLFLVDISKKEVKTQYGSIGKSYRTKIRAEMIVSSIFMSHDAPVACRRDMVDQNRERSINATKERVSPTLDKVATKIFKPTMSRGITCWASINVVTTGQLL
jgi:hypothetical protein